jgi:hypothetical protein
LRRVSPLELPEPEHPGLKIEAWATHTLSLALTFLTSSSKKLVD